MRQAVHRTTFEAGRKVQVVSELRALRNLPYAGLVSVQVKALTDVVLEIRNGMNVPDDYANWMPMVHACICWRQKPFLQESTGR